MGGGVVPETPVTFGVLLRKLRDDAGLTQEELAEAASVSPRSVSDLERGVNKTARKDTARLLAGALGLTGTARAVFEAMARGREPAQTSGVGQGAAATRTLPRDSASFVGRERELAKLVGAASDVSGSADVVGIYVIGGMAGVGKTAFAVHAAHHLAAQFPGGQIFLRLHGHTPGQQPTAPVDALASLLLTAGVVPDQIPPGLEARTALWRDRLAGNPLLLVVDDAVDSQQVEPLLPGSGGSMVLVTSRRHLSALEGARAISLDTLAEEEAAQLVVRLAGRPELSVQDAAVGEIARLCGCLPLALGMLARQLHHHGAWTAAELAADLVAARDRMALMTTENLSVAAAFDLSYRDLGPSEQRMFGLLGLHPGSDFDAYAAAALTGEDLEKARHQLAALYDHYLLTEQTKGRYRFHDLIREYARLLSAEESAGSNLLAQTRLLEYYTHAVRSADLQLPRRIPAVSPAVASFSPDYLPDLETREAATAWLAAERMNLDGAVRIAAAADRAEQAVAVATALHAFLRNEGYWDHARNLYQTALDAARRAEDRLGEALILANLGDIVSLAGAYPEATAHLTAARTLMRGIGNPLGEAGALTTLGFTQSLAGDYPAAAASQEQALKLYRTVGDPLGEAQTSKDLGVLLSLVGKYQAAIANHERALRLYRSLGNQLGEANTLNCLAAARILSDDYPPAIRALRNGLDLFCALGYPLGQAFTLTELGVVYTFTGEYQEATVTLTEAIDLFCHLRHRLGQANALKDLAIVQRATGDHSSAMASLTEALELYMGIGNKPGRAGALDCMAGIKQEAGDYWSAASDLSHAFDIYHGLGDRLGETEVLNSMGELSLATGDSDGARERHGLALSIAQDIASQREKARALAGMGRSHLRDGDLGRGGDLLHQALAIYRRIGSSGAARVAETMRDSGL
jgi:tetratricopeptide (TPR) repeat protein/transcriptional regulator with XRE-family HTH domain